MQDEVVIRKNRSMLKMWVISISLAVIFLITMMINDYLNGGGESMWIGVVFIVLCLTALVYFIKELYERKIEITISHKGIRFRKKGFYPWSLIESFSTMEYLDSDVEKLVLHYEKDPDAFFEISDLEKQKDEIIDLILTYKGSSTVYYAGHKVK